MNVVLVMFRENGDRRSFSLTRDVTVIGRREDAHFRIPLTDVSRKHCRLVKDGNTLLVEDLGSSNGTYHNGERVQEAEIKPGDTLRIGPVQFLVQIDGVPADEDLGGQSGSGLVDSASTMMSPSFAPPPPPPPPVPPRFGPTIGAAIGDSASQPTIDETPLELGRDDFVTSDDIGDQESAPDAEAALEAEADAEIEDSFITDEPDSPAEDELLIEDAPAPAAETVEAGGSDVVPPTDLVLEEFDAPEEEDLPDLTLAPPAHHSHPPPPLPLPIKIPAETAPIVSIGDELAIEPEADEAEPALDHADTDSAASGFAVMHDSVTDDEDDVLIDFDLPDEPKK